MAKEQATEAIVLRSRQYSNTSAIITVFTRDHGKQVLMGRGVRRYRKNAPCMDLGYHLFLRFLDKPDVNVKPLFDFEIYDDFYGIRQRYDGLMTLPRVLRLVEALTAENQADEQIFDALRKTLSALEHTPNRAILPWFVVGMLDQAGYAHSWGANLPWVEPTLAYLREHDVSTVQRLKLSHDQEQFLLSYARDMIRTHLHVDVPMVGTQHGPATRMNRAS